MDKKCSFLLCQEQPSASGYFALWETDGIHERLPPPNGSYIRVTVIAGQHFLLRQEHTGDEVEGS